MPTCTARLLWCSIPNLDSPRQPPGSANPVPWRLGRRLLGLTAAVMLACCGPASVEPDQFKQVVRVEKIYGACVEEMLRNTCNVTNDKAPSASTAPPASVFVAGAGQVDAASYQRLRDAGDAMCELVRKSCTETWSGAACRTSRSLWAK